MNKCIDCYHYDSKEDLCIHGSPIFIDDICTDYQDSEFIEQIKADLIREVEKKVRAEVIEECIEKLYEVTPQTVDEKLDMVFVNALRELKEQK